MISAGEVLSPEADKSYAFTSPLRTRDCNAASTSERSIVSPHLAATCVEAVVENAVDRWGLLHAVLDRLLTWRRRLGSAEFVMAWGARLAFRGEWVQVSFEGQPPLEGQVLGLTADGRLRLRDRQGALHELNGGELNVRPLSAVNSLE